MDATIITSLIVLLSTVITLVTGIAGFGKLLKEFRSDRVKQDTEKAKQTAENVVSSVEAAGRVTQSALQISDALRNELSDCYEKLGDQTELRLREAEMRMRIGEVANRIAQILSDVSIESPRCLIHRSQLIGIQMELQALAHPSASTQPLHVIRKDDKDDA